ncbi:MAG: ferrochelatase [Planctomycetota bacterium]|nr:MAG: ferrochelatase [Planctomycetota bacterium]
MAQAYDAVLVVAFGGPEGPDDVLPFLENVLRGKNVPRERMLAVAEHYKLFGGKSPLNEQTRALVDALRSELESHGPALPVYWGNRNWRPMLPDTLAEMARDGVRKALGFFTSAYSSYSSCRQYRENIAEAQRVVGPQAPSVEKLRVYYNHPGFIEPMIERVRSALEQIPSDRRARTKLLYTAHSIPLSMAEHCDYAAQIAEASRLVSDALQHTNDEVVYQSRSGPPQQPWLEPDVCDALRTAADAGINDVVVVPIGFLSDHVEVLYDLDIEARNVAAELGINLVRATTVGSHPDFVRMIRELILERTAGAPRRALGTFGPSHDVCPEDCCLYPRTRPAPSV